MNQALIERGYNAGLPNEEKTPVKVRNPLHECFEEWLGRLGTFGIPIGLHEMNLANILLKKYNLKPNPDEAAALLGKYAGHLLSGYFGIFLNAAYIKSEENVIVHRGTGSVDITAIGMALSKNKTLIIPEGNYVPNVGPRARGKIVHNGASKYACEEFKGIAIVNGIVDAHVGKHSKGLIFFGGKTKDFGNSAKGIIVFYGEAERVCAYASGTLICLKSDVKPYQSSGRSIHCLQASALGLEDYLMSIVAPFRPSQPVEKQVEAAKLLDKKTIEDTIKSMLRREGYGA